jgi:hypothetical protein
MMCYLIHFLLRVIRTLLLKNGCNRQKLTQKKKKKKNVGTFGFAVADNSDWTSSNTLVLIVYRWGAITFFYDDNKASMVALPSGDWGAWGLLWKVSRATMLAFIARVKQACWYLKLLAKSSICFIVRSLPFFLRQWRRLDCSLHGPQECCTLQQNRPQDSCNCVQ